MPGKIHSKAQARWFGAVASGKVKAKGLTPAEAREALKAEPKGAIKKLPSRSHKRSR